MKVSLAPPGTGAGGVAGTWMDRDNSEKPPLARVNEMMSRLVKGIAFNKVKF